MARLSTRLSLVALALALAVVGASSKKVKLAFIGYTAETRKVCQDTLGKNACANRCSRAFDVENVKGALTLTPTLMQDKCNSKIALCGVGTGTYVDKSTALTLSFTQPKAQTKVYTVQGVGDPQKGFKMTYTFGNAKAKQECVAEYGVLEANGKPVTEKLRNSNINWNKVIGRDALLKKMGAKQPTNAQKQGLAKKQTSSATAVIASAVTSAEATATTACATDASSTACVTAKQKSKTISTAATGALPADYNVHTAHPECKPVIQNQGDCGSCWAFSTTGVLAQRLCLKSGDIAGLNLSPQAHITCDNTCFDYRTGKSCVSTAANTDTCICQGGCEGGYTGYAFEFMRDKGVTSDVCVPYTSAPGTNPMEGACTTGTGTSASTVESLVKSCTTPSAGDTKTFKALDTYALSTEDEIKRDIWTLGPVQATFLVETPLYGYTGGVFSCDGEEDAGGHAVIMVGWGVEDGVNYWLLQNSWGPDWGENGYVKMLRDAKDPDKSCLVMDYINTATADTKGVTYNGTSLSSSSPPDDGSVPKAGSARLGLDLAGVVVAAVAVAFAAGF